ncbi:MAG: SLC13 family permease [Phycisphaeraceae bacterium]|nr:MAG: SLC13 family permease [Phycisphaeraceae bacterium]
MSAAAIVVILIILLVLLLLAFTRISPDAVLVGALTLLMVVPYPTDTGWVIGVLSGPQALGGFSNEGMITVGVLFVVVRGLLETGGVDWIAQRVLGRPKGLRPAMCRVIFPVGGMSAFLNNTPVVAMLIPAVQDWAKRLDIKPSKLMIPLSYGAILGGTCTLIGTSTNLVVAGMVISSTDLPPIGMFDITRIGLPCAILGALFLIFVGPKLLPDRGSARSTMADPREYTVEMIIPPGSGLAKRTVEDAGLRALPGAFVIEIERDGVILAPVAPDQVLLEGDRLVFTGVVDSIRELQNLRGLQPATDQIFKLDSPRYRRRLFEAVISQSSPIVGKSIREAKFRSRYDAAVLAVARDGERLRKKIGDIEVKPGDTLLIEAHPEFDERHRDSREFLLVSALHDSTPRRHSRAPLAMLILLAMVVAATSGVFTMLQAALLASGLLIFTRCCTISEARKSIDWTVLLVIGAAIGLGRALEVSGAASSIANAIVIVAGSNPWLVLAAVYITTSIFTEIITNNAAVALVFPIAYATSATLGVDFMPFIFTIMMAGSASFASPLGYQTNLMVYGPGGYKFTDFLRIGLPMNALMAITTITLAPMIWNFNPVP